MKYVLIVYLSIIIQLSYAATDGWVTRDGKPVPNSNAIKSINGFGGWLLITPEPDWEKKWNTSSETIPYFAEATEVSYGKKLTILTFFINPKTNAAGEIDVLCDIKVTRPNGSISVDAKGIKCASGKLIGNPRNIRMASAVIKYIGEEGDPPGKWNVEVTLTDKVRGTVIPLRAHFNLQRKKANNQINKDTQLNAGH
ncbi:MAG: hypothetical protein AXA67_08785 [Methylothermaceae bacteria B42]|nr:MAG: hypothetical protein AXA67_08785 [Methylothermaceae bacteria B42]HFD33196.1 hypothetical protein [Gammaproteobacteria bacterium]